MHEMKIKSILYFFLIFSFLKIYWNTSFNQISELTNKFNIISN